MGAPKESESGASVKRSAPKGGRGMGGNRVVLPDVENCHEACKRSECHLQD